ncbi:histone deacetylase complex subunit SAP130b isoform X1 [Danio rerio]|uniref:Histone deacetylase complex subunit SAP130b n=1 Tax=Danio rerio TaxID=7955 RepID=B0S8H2_DANRE|nr:histone deacetylase complex subunit SAP130b [Danio rerio]XP_005171259.1 histone deacetylase complex subunit SAP130 isoform X1 [Danio rerio]|eukprot:NP_001243552.1 histone deacetylase complex subunit SAP130 [Danio rerio]
MNSQQYPRPGLPSGLGQGQTAGNNTAGFPGSQKSTGHEDSNHAPRELMSSGATVFRDDKQETVVVRPYPQPQMQPPSHGAAPTLPPPLPQHLPIQPVSVSAAPSHLPQGLSLAFTEGSLKSALKAPMSSRVIAPAPVPTPSHLTLPPKVPGHLTATMESTQASGIPVATISGQQGHSGNLHHLMTSVQIIRSGAPVQQIGSSAAPQHCFPSHLPRGAAAAAVMSSSKGATGLRPAAGPSSATGQPTVQHIIHQPIQSRPIVTTSTAVLPTVVAPVTATRPQSPVITTVAAHSGDMVHGRSAVAIHPPQATLSIQRPPPSRDTPTRITLPSHPAIAAQKALSHSVAQKPIFSTVTPVAAATVAPIQVTNTAPSPTTTGSTPHTQISNSNIVTMTVASHSSHATAVTTSTIPVAKVVPQPITHTSPRIQSEYTERGNLIPISGHRSSPNPITMENRTDNRQSVPVQFQYFLPTYQSAPYPLTHTYTPITSSVSSIRPYPVTAQAPSAAMPTQAGVGVASAVHLNSMQLMTVDRITQINTQNIQPGAMTAQGIQPTPIPAQNLHTSAQITTPSIQPSPVNQQQPPTESKASVVLADGSTLMANSISNAFSNSQPTTTLAQTHIQNANTGTPSLVTSPRPSILRKKPANEGAAVRKNLIPAQLGDTTAPRIDGPIRSASGSPRPAGVKPKPDIHMSLAPSVAAAIEAIPSQGTEQQAQHVGPPSSQLASQPLPSLLASVTPPSLPAPALSALPAAMTVTQPIPSMTNVVAQPIQPAANNTSVCTINSNLPELNIKQEPEPMDSSKPVALGPNSGAQMLTVPPTDLTLGASPRKKPRKQQHIISTEESEMMETNSTDEEKFPPKPLSQRAEKRKSPPKEYIDEEGVRYVPARVRPPITLLRHYRNPWKAAYHHFQRYSDVRIKEDKKGSMQDVANQKGVVCRAQGWKIHLCAAQLMQLSNLEHDVYSRLTTLQEGFVPKKKAGADVDLHRINELIQGNMQRCKLVMDQITEARDSMLKVLDHKERVLKLLNKNSSTKKLNKLKRKDRA